MNAQQAFEAGYAPFSTITFCGEKDTQGFYIRHESPYGSYRLSLGMRYHRPDGRIGVAY